MKSPLSFTCPSCGASGQRFSVWQTLRQSVKTRCVQCGATVVSDMGIGKFLVFLFYGNLITLVFALPVIFAIIGKSWVVALVLFILYMGMLFIPAIIVHSRSAARLHND